MSVAFRRDGDEEHLEPKFEIPIPAGPNRVTARGLALIRARIAALDEQVAALTQAVQDHGEAAASTLAAHKRDLRYWQTREVTAELVPPPDGTTAEFGTTVVFQLGGRERRLSIVGHDEADPAQGLIAFSAPLARALAGSQAGDVLPYAGKDDAIEVVAIVPGLSQ